MRSLTIGLDFGTCATKCVVHVECQGSSPQHLAFAFNVGDTSPNGCLCLPTAIAASDGHLLFGAKAEASREHEVIRSFKMAIPALSASTWGAYRSLFLIPSRPGHFNIAGCQLSASELAALYLAVVIREIRDRFVRLRNISRVPVYLNLAAPMDQLIATDVTDDTVAATTVEQVRDTRLAREYRSFGQWALAMAPQARNPWPVDEAIAILREVQRQPLLPVKRSPVNVVPETVAAITEFANRPGTSAGRYMTFDVGAGTTDVSVFWLQHSINMIKPWYYASRSLHVGMTGPSASIEHRMPSTANAAISVVVFQ